MHPFSPRVLQFTTIAVMYLICSTSNSPAILIRHDRDDADYLADPVQYPFLADVAAAHGTLIAPDWVLTSAHVAEGVSPLAGVIRIGGRTMRVRRVVFHPTWIGDLPPGFAEASWIDMALIQLEEPVTEVTPVRLYEKSNEKGREVTLIGRGKTGDGRTGPLREDRKLRTATNVVSMVKANLLYFAFDAPPGGTAFEGVGGPGDSGGPALVRDGESYYVLGVCYRNDGQGNGDVEFKYGTSDAYVRVSTNLDWIRRVLASGRERTVWKEVGVSSWPEGEIGEAAKSFFEAFASADRGRLLAFEEQWRAGEALRGLSAEIRADKWMLQSRKWRELVPLRWHLFTPSTLVVLARSGTQWRSVFISMQGPRPYRIREILVARESEQDIPK